MVPILRRLLRATVKPFVQKIQARLADPIRAYSIDGLTLFAHEHEFITRTFSSYKSRPDTEKYSDFYFLKLIYERWRSCNLVDVGVNYGQDLLLISAYKQNHGIPGEIIGFEPNTRTFALLEHTFRANGIPARFERVALGDQPGSIILEGIKNNSQGMTTVGLSFPNLYEVVEVRTLDMALAHLFDKPCLLKLDTQGAEWLIFKGGERFCTKNDLIIRTEFTPSGTKGIQGTDLLRSYLERYIVLDAKSNKKVAIACVDEFIQRVTTQYPYGYTDLYLIPRNSPLAGEI